VVKPNGKKQRCKPVFPADPVGAEFGKWFWTSSSGWDWISGTPPAPGVKTKWETENKFPIQPVELWHRFLDPNEAIGVRYKGAASYLVIDLDSWSPNHPTLNPSIYMGLIYTLREIGLIGYVAVRSTWSGGIHLYFPLPKPVNSFRLACRARLALEREGFKIQSGSLEIFPNTKRHAKKGKGISRFNAHRLPLQPGSGSYLLDDALKPYSDRVEDLLSAFQEVASKQNMELLESGLEEDYKKFKRSRFNHIGNSTEKWLSYLESIKAQGWTGHGQTNQILLALAAYARVFLRFGGDELLAAVERMAINAPGYEQFCRHQHEIELRAQDVARSAEAYYWKLGDEPSREGTYRSHFHRESGAGARPPKNNIVDFNLAQSANATERLRQAVAALEDAGSLPDSARARMEAIIAIAKLFGSGISATTLYKPQNLPLWHPDHYQTTPRDVTPLTEPVLSDDAPPQSQKPESPEPAPEALLHPSPLYEGYVRAALDGAAPQEPLAPDNDVLEGESEGEKAPSFDAAPIHNNHSGHDTLAPVEPPSAAPVEPPSAAAPATLAPVPTQANTLEPDAAPLTPADIIRITKLRLELGQRAKRAVQAQVKRELRLISGSERSRLEQAEKMRLYLESGSEVLVAEADLWRWQQAAANSQSPEAEPEPHPEPEPQALAERETCVKLGSTDSTPLGRSASSLQAAEREAALDASPAASTSNSAADETESAYYLDYLEAPDPADFDATAAGQDAATGKDDVTTATQDTPDPTVPSGIAQSSPTRPEDQTAPSQTALKIARAKLEVDQTALAAPEASSFQTDAMPPTAYELELEGYYEQYLEPPNPADFEVPSGYQPDPEIQRLIRERRVETDDELVAPTTNPEPATKLTHDCSGAESPQSEPAIALQPEPIFKVGDRVKRVNAPAHWSSWGALTITDIQSGLVLVDCSQIWIPMSELRHVDDDEGVNSG